MSGAEVTEDDVVLLRAGSGTIHMGVPLGRGWDTFCCHMIDSPHVRTYGEDTAGPLLERSSRFLCEDCTALADRPWSVIRRITGW